MGSGTKLLKTKNIKELKELQEKYGIKEKSIKGTGKNGGILKDDRIKSIRKFERKEEKKSKSRKAKNPKEVPKVKKDKKEGIAAVPKQKKAKNLDPKSMTIPEILLQLHKIEKYKGLTDYAIKRNANAFTKDLLYAEYLKASKINPQKMKKISHNRDKFSEKKVPKMSSMKIPILVPDVMSKIMMDADISTLKNMCSSDKNVKAKCDTDVAFWKSKFHHDRVPFLFTEGAYPKKVYQWINGYTFSKKKIEDNIDKIESDSSIYIYTKIPGKNVRSLIPPRVYESLSNKDKKLLNLERQVEIILSLIDGGEYIIITTSRNDKQRMRDYNKVNLFDLDKLAEDTFYLGKNPVRIDNVNRDTVIEMLCNIMEKFPNKELQWFSALEDEW